MRKLVFILFFLLVYSGYAQNYKLLPDSCTYCFYTYGVVNGDWLNAFYEIQPNSDTMISGNTYHPVSYYSTDLAYIRQEGDELYGLIPDSVMTESLLMKFDIGIGDTIHDILTINTSDLYPHIQINAIVLDIDSIQLLDGSYYNWILLEGYEWNDNTSWQSYSWEFKWGEKGLCNFQGSLLNTFPFDYVGTGYPDTYINAQYCTSDPLIPDNSYFNNSSYHDCDNCVPTISNVIETVKNNFEVYPNPNNGEFQIDLSNRLHDEEIIITDLFGKVVYQKAISTGRFLLDELVDGVYIVYVRTEETISNAQKIIVLR